MPDLQATEQQLKLSIAADKKLLDHLRCRAEKIRKTEWETLKRLRATEVKYADVYHRLHIPRLVAVH